MRARAPRLVLVALAAIAAAAVKQPASAGPASWLQPEPAKPLGEHGAGLPLPGVPLLVLQQQPQRPMLTPPQQRQRQQLLLHAQSHPQLLLPFLDQMASTRPSAGQIPLLHPEEMVPVAEADSGGMQQHGGGYAPGEEVVSLKSQDLGHASYASLVSPSPYPPPPPGPPLKYPPPPPEVDGGGLRINMTGVPSTDARSVAVVDALDILEAIWVPISTSCVAIGLFFMHNGLMNSLAADAASKRAAERVRRKTRARAGKGADGGSGPGPSKDDSSLWCGLVCAWMSCGEETKEIINISVVALCYLLCSFRYVETRSARPWPPRALPWTKPPPSSQSIPGPGTPHHCSHLPKLDSRLVLTLPSWTTISLSRASQLSRLQQARPHLATPALSGRGHTNGCDLRSPSRREWLHRCAVPLAHLAQCAERVRRLLPLPIAGLRSLQKGIQGRPWCRPDPRPGDGPDDVRALLWPRGQQPDEQQ